MAEDSSSNLSTTNCSGNSCVTIARLSLHVADDEYARLVNVLSEDEKERSLRRLPEVRRRAVVSRGRLRVLLGRLIGVSPEEVALTTGRYGKPYLSELHQSSIQFNVAHSMDEAVVAVSHQGAIGVDLEKRKTTHNQRWAHLMAPTIFSESEMTQHVEGRGRLSPEEILDCWVAKEAVLKAIGTGIGDKLRTCQLPADLPRFKMSIDAEASSCRLATVVFKDQDFFPGNKIGITLIDLGEGTHLAVARPGQICKLAVRSFDSILHDGLMEG